MLCSAIPNGVKADDTGIPHTHLSSDLDAEREMRRAQRRVEKRQERDAAREERMKRYSRNSEPETQQANRDLTIGSSNARANNGAAAQPKTRYIRPEKRSITTTPGRVWQR